MCFISGIRKKCANLSTVTSGWNSIVVSTNYFFEACLISSNSSVGQFLKLTLPSLFTL